MLTLKQKLAIELVINGQMILADGTPITETLDELKLDTIPRRGDKEFHAYAKLLRAKLKAKMETQKPRVYSVDTETFEESERREI